MNDNRRVLGYVMTEMKQILNGTTKAAIEVRSHRVSWLAYKPWLSCVACDV